MIISDEEYAYWVKTRSVQRPHQTPPTKEELIQLCKMFNFTKEELGICLPPDPQ